MKETSLSLTDDARFNQFTDWMSDQIKVHGVAIGYHETEGPNTLFDFIASFDPLYRHPIGEVISKVREFAQQNPTQPVLLAKAAAWLFLIYNDLTKKGETNGPTQNRTGRRAYTKRTRRGPGRPKLSRNARKGR